MTELNNKLSINSSTQSITSNLITAKSLIISDTKAYSSNTQSSQVSAMISNNGTSGVSSLFVKTLVDTSWTTFVKNWLPFIEKSGHTELPT